MEERIPLIDGDPDSINYHVELHFTELVDYKNKESLNLVKKELVKQFFDIKKSDCSLDPITNFKEMIIDLTQNYRKEGLELKKEYGEMGYMLNYELIKSSKIIYNENNLLIIELETYFYSGGAHGMGTKNYLHFDMKTGESFTLKDVFEKGFEKGINKIIQLRCIEKENSEEDFFIFKENKPTANENFYFDDKNLYFVYNPYEIAPYSSGFVTIDIPIEKIEKWLNKNGPVAFH